MMLDLPYSNDTLTYTLRTRMRASCLDCSFDRGSFLSAMLLTTVCMLRRISSCLIIVLYINSCLTAMRLTAVFAQPCSVHSFWSTCLILSPCHLSVSAPILISPPSLPLRRRANGLSRPRLAPTHPL